MSVYYLFCDHIIFTLSRYSKVEDPKKLFSNAERSRIVYELLNRTRYDAKQEEPIGKSTDVKVGIDSLLEDKTYTAAFPLHEVCHEHKCCV